MMGLTQEDHKKMKGLNYRKSVGWLSTGNGEGSLGLLKKGIEKVKEKLKLKKYNPILRKYTIHKEIK